MRKLRFHGTVHVLPNIFTAANIVLGIKAITLIHKGDALGFGQDVTRYDLAAIYLLLAMLFDVFDGLVARLTNTTSRFGLEFDSLADVVSFGVAPAMMVYSQWLSVCDKAALKTPSPLGFLVVAIYIGCAALRLARFNSRIEDETKTFSGLPTPAAAGVIASYFMLQEADIVPHAIIGFINYWILPIVTAGLGALMVSRIRYPAIAKQILWRKHPFTYLVFAAGIIALMIAQRGATLFLLFTGYAVFGIVTELRRPSAPPSPSSPPSVPETTHDVEPAAQ